MGSLYPLGKVSAVKLTTELLNWRLDRWLDGEEVPGGQLEAEAGDGEEDSDGDE